MTVEFSETVLEDKPIAVVPTAPDYQMKFPAVYHDLDGMLDKVVKEAQQDGKKV